MLTRLRQIAPDRATPARISGGGRGGTIWTGSALAIAALAAVPIVAILAVLPIGGFAAWSHIAATMLPTYVANTLALMLMAGAIAGAIGIGTAWLVTATRFPGRAALSWMLILPLAVPAYIAAYIYADLFAFAGPLQNGLRGLFGWQQAGDYWFPAIRSLPGAALILALVLYPYVYLLARAGFAAQSVSQFNAARTLGLTPTRAFLRIALPGARPAIAGGLTLVLMETLADFGVADYFAIPTFSTGIFRSWLAMGDRPAAMKLAAVMLLFVVLLVAIETLSRRGRVESADAMADAPPMLALSGMRAGFALLACALPVLLGFAIPALALIANALAVADGQHWTTLASYARDSVVLATITASVAISVSLLLAYAQRESGSSLVRGAIRLSTLGYALPGALLAVGLLLPLGAFDQMLTRFARDSFGWNQGLLLTGSSAILIYALTVRFLTVSFNSVSGGMAKVPHAMDAAARSLGASPRHVIWRIHLPQLRFSLAAGAALVFIDTLRELPATLILRPFNLETLATRVYRLASDERLAEASTAALLILLAGLIPVMLLSGARRG